MGTLGSCGGGVGVGGRADPKKNVGLAWLRRGSGNACRHLREPDVCKVERAFLTINRLKNLGCTCGNIGSRGAEGGWDQFF